MLELIIILSHLNTLLGNLPTPNVYILHVNVLLMSWCQYAELLRKNSSISTREQQKKNMHVFVYMPITCMQEYSSCCQGFLVHVNVVTDLTSAYGDNFYL